MLWGGWEEIIQQCMGLLAVSQGLALARLGLNCGKQICKGVHVLRLYW